MKQSQLGRRRLHDQKPYSISNGRICHRDPMCSFPKCSVATERSYGVSIEGNSGTHVLYQVQCVCDLQGNFLHLQSGDTFLLLTCGSETLYQSLQFWSKRLALLPACDHGVRWVPGTVQWIVD